MKKCFKFPSKNRYSTKRDAETTILLSDEKNLKIYFCDSCSGWHLASTIKK